MSDWNFFERRGGGRGTHGPQWGKVPCISINGSGLTFNEQMLLKYSDSATQCFVMHTNGDGVRRIGIKFIPRGEENPEAFSLRIASSTTSKSKIVACKAIAKQFEDLRGMAFRCMKDPSGNIVVADLTPDNKV